MLASMPAFPESKKILIIADWGKDPFPMIYRINIPVTKLKIGSSGRPDKKHLKRQANP